MKNRLTWHGHAAFSLTTSSGQELLLDPWLDGNPASDIKCSDITKADYILVSHGHGDHFSDVIKLAQQTGATVIAAHELAVFCQSNGVANVHGMSVGGGFKFPFGYVKVTVALHGPGVDGADIATVPNGWWIDLGDARVYFAGDTALTMDMQLLQGRVDVALLPIGDNYTMGPEDAARAVEMIKPRAVIPMHYNTFDIIKQDPDDFKRRVGGNAEVVILQPGGSFDF
jgi:L-ascorbate metabolism protein UlaG (beta-lactamase superfamily)